MMARRTHMQELMVGIALLALGVVGCQSSQPRAATQPATAPAGENARMEDTIAGSDAERAKAALERDQRRGELRPATPRRPPVVDQPQPPRR
ncbi:MAG: hypothetical protein KKI02_12645 [Planctomycetes bacterium]|nr:hypothetical protein [Planctomycetota bacterium]